MLGKELSEIYLADVTFCGKSCVGKRGVAIFVVDHVDRRLQFAWNTVKTQLVKHAVKNTEYLRPISIDAFDCKP